MRQPFVVVGAFLLSCLCSEAGALQPVAASLRPPASGARAAGVRLVATAEDLSLDKSSWAMVEVAVTPSVQETFDSIAVDGVVGRQQLRNVLDDYGVRSGADSVMQAYTGDRMGALGVREFAQLISVLEATRLAGGDDSRGGGHSSSSGGGANRFIEDVGEAAYDAVSSVARNLVERPEDEAEDLKVQFALKRMQRDMSMLDLAAGATPQLSPAEFLLLLSTVGVSFFSPYVLTAKVVEVLVPSMGALAAAVGFSAEYTGKVAVSRGKEIAATTLQAAAEAELYLAQAERAKAIIPLCVGISATASAFALVAPALVGELVTRGVTAAITTEVFLLCPLFAVLAAAVAALANQESNSLASRAMGVGSRRFASAGDVGRTWLSATEQIAASTERSKDKWASFSLGVLPAPTLAVLCPGPLSFKAIVAAAVAAAQAAYSLASAEYTLAAAVESVAVKSRSAAVSDTYANQGARAGAILPFTSALSGLCAATTVAVVEVLPLVPSVVGESLVCVVFPALGSLIAAAASISKARCEVDAAAATAAATTLADAAPNGRPNRDPILSTVELVRLTLKNARATARRVKVIDMVFRLVDRLLSAARKRGGGRSAGALA